MDQSFLKTVGHYCNNIQWSSNSFWKVSVCGIKVEGFEKKSTISLTCVFATLLATQVTSDLLTVEHYLTYLLLSQRIVRFHLDPSLRSKHAMFNLLKFYLQWSLDPNNENQPYIKSIHTVVDRNDHIFLATYWAILHIQFNCITALHFDYVEINFHTHDQL